MHWNRVAATAVLACAWASAVDIADLAEIAPGWKATIVAEVDQSYAGWDVEIGDADNDSRNEILVTGCPDSRLYMFKKSGESWQTRLLADRLAQRYPAMGLAVRVADLNNDNKNEIVFGTGQEADQTAFFYVLSTDGSQITQKLVSQPECNKSAYTHSFGIYDIDGDGIKEVLSAYCGGGEVIRYDLDSAMTKIEARKICHLTGSGEDSQIADVDNDGAVEYITSNSFRAGRARIEIFEFDDKGELVAPPRLIIDGYNSKPCFYASFTVGDFDNDGKKELIAGWKQDQKINQASLVAYRVGETAGLAYVLEEETKDLDMAYFEKMMAVADADNDGKNELIISTRGDNMSEFITSEHLGQVYMYSLDENKEVKRELLANFNEKYAESSWLAVSDADNDGKNEIVLATGKGDRTKPGTSYIVIIEKQQG